MIKHTPEQSGATALDHSCGTEPSTLASFKAWLYRPFLDLGSTEATGNPHLAGPLYAFRAVAERRPFPRLHGVILPSARKAMVREARLPALDVDDPLAVPEALRTPEWQTFCDTLQQYDGLDAEEQVGVLWLLHRLCFHDQILRYAGPASDRAAGQSESGAAIAFMRGLAQYARCSDGMGALDTTDLEQAATQGPAGGWARVEATYFLAAISAKVDHDLAALEHWLNEHQAAIETAGVDDHTHCKLLSRYYRIHAFVPQFASNWPAMSADMDSSESWAERMRRDTPDTLAEWKLITLAINESRTKEALVLGDLHRAELWARRGVQHAPSDPRSHLELGQVLIEQGRIPEALHAYQRAARFGPPGTEIAWFMIGQCHQALQEPERACDAFLASLDLDPLAVSAAERLADAAAASGSSDLVVWASAKARSLGQAEATRDPIGNRKKPYQIYSGTLGKS